MANSLAIFIAFVVAAAGVTAGVSAMLMMDGNESQEDLMPTFSDYAALEAYLDRARAGINGNDTYNADFGGQPGGMPQANENDRGSSGSPDYSKTNVQVEGVDEADTVKTDGEYIYTVNSGSIAIIKAYPPTEMEVRHYINTTDLQSKENESIWFSGIYLAADKLIVIASVYEYAYVNPGDPIAYDMLWWNPTNERTVVYIFDISDPSNPQLTNSFSISGYPVTSRMTDGVVYSISNMWIYQIDDDYVIPEVDDGTGSAEVEIPSIHYDPEIKDAGNYMNILAIDLDAMTADTMSIIMGWSSVTYMSTNALYLTFEKWTGEAVPMPVFAEADDANSTDPSDGTDSSDEYDYTTTIYKVDVNGTSMRVSARGDIGGTLLNQFSLDEYDGYLRAATTSSWINPESSVFVLDGKLKVVGKIEGLAPTERIQSARFVGDMLYLVTFRQIDPLFVIDLSVPADPKVVGELKTPGFSQYLHPVDADHILGVGRENSTVKISLFDVSNRSNPMEVSKYLIESDWAWSVSGWDYKAILFDAEKEILVIPVSIYNSNWTDSWTGVYVFNVSVDGGISLRGTIAHSDSYWNYIERSLYIGEYLYTISYTTLKVNQLSDLSEVGTLAINAPQYYYFEDGSVVRAG